MRRLGAPIPLHSPALVSPSVTDKLVLLRASSLRLLQCDVRDDAEIAAVAAALLPRFDGRLDALLHSVAFAPPEALGGGSLMATSRESWATTLDVSAYSLLALTKGLHPLLQAAALSTRGGDGITHVGPSITTLSFIGACSRVAHLLLLCDRSV